MAKRFIDTGFFKSPFVRSLQAPTKLLYTFIICDCDGAGMWPKDLEVASLYCGVKITDANWKVFLDSGKAIDLKDGKYFFPDFIEHQYPKGLQEKNPAHKNFIELLRKYDLVDENLLIKIDPPKGLQSPSKGSKVKVMVIEEVIEEVKESDSEIKMIIENLVKSGLSEDEAQRKANEIYETDKIEFQRFTEWVKDNAESVSKMPKPFTQLQYVTLREKLGKDAIRDYVLKMDNYKPLLQKNKSAYQTLLNWQRRNGN